MGLLKPYRNIERPKMAPAPQISKKNIKQEELQALKCKSCSAPLNADNNCDHCGTRHAATINEKGKRIIPLTLPGDRAKF